MAKSVAALVFGLVIGFGMFTHQLVVVSCVISTGRPGWCQLRPVLSRTGSNAMLEPSPRLCMSINSCHINPIWGRNSKVGSRMERWVDTELRGNKPLGLVNLKLHLS